jgi:hypothetical protein
MHHRSFGRRLRSPGQLSLCRSSSSHCPHLNWRRRGRTVANSPRTSVGVLGAPPLHSQTSGVTQHWSHPVHRQGCRHFTLRLMSICAPLFAMHRLRSVKLFGAPSGLLHGRRRRVAIPRGCQRLDRVCRGCTYGSTRDQSTIITSCTQDALGERASASFLDIRKIEHYKIVPRATHPQEIEGR